MAHGITAKFSRFDKKGKGPFSIFKVFSSYAVDEIDQTAFLIASLEFKIMPIITQINANLAVIADKLEALSNQIFKINVSISSLISIKSQQTAILASRVSNQIITNNFFKLVNAEKVTMQTLEEQIKDALELAIKFEQAARATAVVNNMINSTLSSASDVLKQTAAFQTVEGWLNDIKSSITTLAPLSARTVESITKAAAGIRATPE